jgi:Amt family ammonium transporter
MNRIASFFFGWRPGLTAVALGIAILTAFLCTPSTLRADDEPKPDATGSYMSTPTTAPSGSVPGYIAPTEKSSPKEMADAINAVASSTSRNFFAANYTWMLVAGFLVMFMQAGFALVETGLCRAKNAAHTMSMNFMVYALGMFGFFVCGYALMCGGVNGTAICSLG